LLQVTFLMKAGPEGIQRLGQRVAGELTATFASYCSAEISLEEALHPGMVAADRKKSAGAKFLINPAKGFYILRSARIGRRRHRTPMLLAAGLSNHATCPWRESPRLCSSAGPSLRPSRLGH